MLDEWYCELDGRMMGPLSSQQLKAMAAAGRLLPTDPVRRRDMMDWVEADQVAGLFELAPPPRAVDPPKGLPPALPEHHALDPTSVLQPSETPPDIPLARADARAQDDDATEPFDPPISVHRGRLSTLRSPSRHKRQQRMLITGMTAFVAVAVVILYLFWAAGGFDDDQGVVTERGGFSGMAVKAAQKPADEIAKPQKNRQSAPPSTVGKSNETKAAAVKPNVDEKHNGGELEVVNAKKTAAKPAEKPAEKEEPDVPDNEDESQWIDASTMSPAAFDKIHVEVLSAAWEGADAETFGGSHLKIAIRVQNTGVLSSVTFTGWSPAAAQHGVTLIDNRQRTVKAMAADPANTVANLLPIKINPGKSAGDVLLFEAPSPKVKYLRLKLSVAAFGKDGTAQFKIPATMIEGTPPSPKPVAAKAVKNPAPRSQRRSRRSPTGPVRQATPNSISAFAPMRRHRNSTSGHFQTAHKPPY